MFMDVVILVDEATHCPEVAYIAKVFSTIIDADISLRQIGTPLPTGAIAVSYCGLPQSLPRLPQDCRVRISPTTRIWEEMKEGHEVKPKFSGDQLPVLRWDDTEPVTVVDDSGVITDDDLILSSYYLMSRYEEVFSTAEPDKHQRFCFADSALGDRLGHSFIHQYLFKLLEWIKEQYRISIPLRSDRMEAVISHDIDIPYYFGKIRSVLSGVKARLTSEGVGSSAQQLFSYIKVRAGMEKDRFATFDYIMQTQAQRGIKSTWFILLCSDNLWGLDLDKYARQLQSIAAAGHEIGLHPGYDSYLDPERRNVEKKAIEQLSGCTITGARNHFLRFKIPESYHVACDTGFSYDSTLGFAECEGFRAGFCSPFKPFDPQRRQTLDILEIPMSIMDGTFRDYLHLPPHEAEVRIKAMIDHVADVRGTIVFNWHNTFLLAEEAAWRKVYENSLDYLISKNAVFTTADELARKWSERWQ